MSANNWSDYFAIFGGSFDPPHRGHQIVVKEISERFQFRKIFVIPNGNHPFKKSIASAEDRLAMARICFPSIANTEILDIESSTTKIHTTLETLHVVKKIANSDRIVFVIGTELLNEIPSWKAYPQVLLECDWLALTRKGSNPRSVQDIRSHSPLSVHIRQLSETADGVIFTLDNQRQIRVIRTQAPEISSTEIRSKIALKGSESIEFKEHLCESVGEYIQKNHLYGME